MDLLHCEALAGAVLLQLMEVPVVDREVDIEVAEDGQLLALLYEVFGPLALRDSFLTRVCDESDLIISHLCGAL